MRSFALLTDTRIPVQLRVELQSLALESDVLMSRGVKVNDRTDAGACLRRLVTRSEHLANRVAPYVTANQNTTGELARTTELVVNSEVPENIRIVNPTEDTKPTAETVEMFSSVRWDSIAIGLGGLILIGGVIVIAAL